MGLESTEGGSKSDLSVCFQEINGITATLAEELFHKGTVCLNGSTTQSEAAVQVLTDCVCVCLRRTAAPGGGGLLAASSSALLCLTAAASG